METGLLSRRVLCSQAEAEAFPDRLNGLFYPADVRTSARGRPAGELRGAHTDHVTVGLMRFGRPTSVDPGLTLSHYHVNVVLRGRITAASGDELSTTAVGGIQVFTPHRHHRLVHCEEGAEQLGIKISRGLVDDELEALLGHPAHTPLEFALDFPADTPAARSWRRAVDLLLAELDEQKGLLESTGAGPYERLLVTGLLLGHRHNHTDELIRSREPARPVAVRRVIDALQARPEEAYTLGDLARLAGVSARRLQECFQESVGIPPMTYLRDVRLDRVRRDLLEGNASVTEAARHWGFGHLGRFSAAYRHRFGENPSTTAGARAWDGPRPAGCISLHQQH